MERGSDARNRLSIGIDCGAGIGVTIRRHREFTAVVGFGVKEVTPMPMGINSQTRQMMAR